MDYNQAPVSEDAIMSLFNKDKTKKAPQRQASENKILESKMKLQAMLSGEPNEYALKLAKEVEQINNVANGKKVLEGGQVITESRPSQPIREEYMMEERIPNDIESLIKQQYQKDRQQQMVSESEITNLISGNKQRQTLNESSQNNEQIIKDTIIKVLAEMLTEDRIKKVMLDVLKKMKK
jgi:hypothetical protein